MDVWKFVLHVAYQDSPNNVISFWIQKIPPRMMSLSRKNSVFYPKIYPIYSTSLYYYANVVHLLIWLRKMRKTLKVRNIAKICRTALILVPFDASRRDDSIGGCLIAVGQTVGSLAFIKVY